MARSEYDIVAGYLKSAAYAFRTDATFGQAIDLRLPHKDRPNGCPVKIRVAVGPKQVACWVKNIKKEDSRVFDVAAKEFLAYADTQMKGWNVERFPGGRMTGGSAFDSHLYRPKTPKLEHALFADLLQAVASARDACVTGKTFRSKSRAERWPSEEMDDGVYPVQWTVEANRPLVIVRIKNKGPNSEAFSNVAGWAFGYVKRKNGDCRDLTPEINFHAVMFKVFSEGLRLEVPCL